MQPLTTELLGPHQIDRASYWLAQDEVVVFPTETVYGMGANALQEAACRRIYAAKGRSFDNPLIVHLATITELLRCASAYPPYLLKLLRSFSPGPLTVILPKASHIPLLVTAGQPTVALRIPAHPLARRLLRRCHFPLAAPSANISGRPSATSGEEAYRELQGRVRAIISGGASKVGLESTIIMPQTQQVTIVRQGAVEAASIRRRLPADVKLNAATKESGIVTPGSRHAHYQPQARLFLFPYANGPAALEMLAERRAEREPMWALIIFSKTLRAISRKRDDRSHLAVCLVLPVGDNRDYAHQLYRLFSTADQARCHYIAAELPDPQGRYYAALYDRLHRAAATAAVAPALDRQ